MAMLAASALIACGGSSTRTGWEGQTDTLATGVVQVHNQGAGTWGPEPSWRLVEEVRIGTADRPGPDLFGDVVGVEVDELGRVWVADAQASEIRVFDAAGRHVRTLGRKGGGPGEFTGLAGLARAADGTLWAVDNGSQRFTVFDSAGAVVAVHPRQDAMAVSPWRGGFDRDGRLHDVGTDAASPEMRPLLNRFGPGLRREASFPIPRQAGEQFVTRTSTGQLAAAVPFTGFPVWALDPGGDVWVGTSDQYRLARVRFDGDTQQVVTRQVGRVGVTREERAAALKELRWFTNAGGRVDEGKIPSIKPALRAFWVDDQGYLWVRPNHPRNELPGFDVIDPQGRYLGTVPSPELGPFPLIRVRGDRLYAAIRGDAEIPQVVIFRIQGRG